MSDSLMEAPRTIMVTGSRSWTDANAVHHKLDHTFTTRDRLIHGGAEGADKIAAAWASAYGVPQLAFLPEYDFHGKQAPHVRNNRMLDRADLVLAFWDGKAEAQSRSSTRPASEASRRRSFVSDGLVTEPLRLSVGQRKALGLMRLARATDPLTDDGAIALCATFYDREIDVAYVYHRTADALVELGLVEYGYFDENGTELKLTEAGLAV